MPPHMQKLRCGTAASCVDRPCRELSRCPADTAAALKRGRWTAVPPVRKDVCVDRYGNGSALVSGASARRVVRNDLRDFCRLYRPAWSAVNAEHAAAGRGFGPTRSTDRLAS